MAYIRGISNRNITRINLQTNITLIVNAASRRNAYQTHHRTINSKTETVVDSCDGLITVLGSGAYICYRYGHNPGSTNNSIPRWKQRKVDSV